MEEKKITIIDVAKLAGVSKGTVDRVLHNRGEVSAKSVQKVKKAIEELNYEPNLYASLLATKKDRTIALLIPKFKDGEFWEKIHEGFIQGGEVVAPFNIGTSVFKYDQYDINSFTSACKKLVDSKPSGVIVSPLFANDMIAFTDTLKKEGIPYIYIDTKPEDDSYLAYFGMPMYKSGYLCAGLLTERKAEEDLKEIAIVRIVRDKTRRSDPTVNRRLGFMDFMSENYPYCEVHNVFVDPSDPKSIESTLDAFFQKHPDVSDVVMFNSRIHLLKGYLSSHPDKKRRVIGFDNLDQNVEMLKSGLVTILISQHVEKQSSMAVQTLSDFILLKKNPARRDNYMHMDILTALNYENY